MEKLEPHYELATIKAAFADPSSLDRSFVSKQGADDLDMGDAAVAAVIQGLSAADFDKSMTSMADHRVWQDVYKPRVRGRTLYVKFTLDAMNALLLIRFKEA
ncbi:MAG: type II toxin-antitoxin system MqsR family toxin [Hyphomicrobiales bacterium]|nr:type II toxin-antitoxin system MqsR family toxin [Hyphomicrobiales bacterium]MDE2018501.1 type II toxin-antitoxin system MqsR family toxin [Hyphomicrobiales bacterium]